MLIQKLGPTSQNYTSMMVYVLDIFARDLKELDVVNWTLKNNWIVNKIWSGQFFKVAKKKEWKQVFYRTKC